ncbi:unnamed protein product [Effrenium voratum]|nr:unnamed protein product [Effrenium voratum]
MQYCGKCISQEKDSSIKIDVDDNTRKLSMIKIEAGTVATLKEANKTVELALDLDNPNLDVNNDEETQVILDFTEDEDLKLMAVARDIVNKVQKMRKDTKLMQDDPVDMWAEVKKTSGKGLLQKSMTKKRDYIVKLLRRGLWDASLLQGHEVLINRESFVIDDAELVVSLTVRGPFFNPKAMKELTKADPAAEAACREYLQTYDLQGLTRFNGSGVKVSFNGKTFEMKHNQHFVIGPLASDAIEVFGPEWPETRQDCLRSALRAPLRAAASREGKRTRRRDEGSARGALCGLAAFAARWLCQKMREHPNVVTAGAGRAPSYFAPCATAEWEVLLTDTSEGALGGQGRFRRRSRRRRTTSARAAGSIRPTTSRAPSRCSSEEAATSPGRRYLPKRRGPKRC